MRGPRSRKLAVYALTAWVPHAVAYVVAPLAVARFAGRSRRRNIPRGPLAIAGVPCLVAGAGLIALAIVGHYRSSGDEVQVTSNPDYLAEAGGYGFTRNPLYLGGLLLWAGWAAVLSSAPVAVAGVVLAAFLARVAVPFEERRLAATFGAAYDDYRQRVPRWLGRRRRAS